MAYTWKTINFPTTTPTTGQHYTAPIVSVTQDGSLALVQQFITDTSGPGPYSLTGFVVGFDAFGNPSSHVPQTTIASAPNAFADSTALAAFESNDQYRLTFPSEHGGVGFFVGSDGSNWNIVRDQITGGENSTTLTVTEDTVDTIPFASGESIVGMFASSRGTGEYGVGYVLQDGSGNVNLLWQGYNADNTLANATPVSLSQGFQSSDSTPAGAVNPGAGAFIEVHENVDGSGFHYLTVDSFDLDGTPNGNIGTGGSGTFDLNSGNTTVTDITEVRFSQFPAGVASGAMTFVSSELRNTDSKYHVVFRFHTSGSTVPTTLSTDDVAQHVQVSHNNNDGTTVVGWADAGTTGAATFAVFDSAGAQVGTTFQAGDSTMRFVNEQSLQDGRIVATFQKTVDAGTQTTQDVIYILDTRTPGQILDDSALSGAGQYNIAGTSGADTITASDTDFTYIAGHMDNDVFAFHTLKLPVGFGDDEITDYNQGDTGHYSAGEGDQIDISGLSGGSSITGAGIHVVDLGYEGTFLAVDPDGATNGYSYWGIAQLDGIHVGQTVNAITNSAIPAGVTVGVESNQGFAGNFNGGIDSNSDLIWRNDSGAVTIWEMNGTSVIGSGNLGAVATSWHIVGLDDFNHDGNSDILWRNDSGDISLWQMNGTSVTGGGTIAAVNPFDWHLDGVGDFNNDSNADILWRGDSGALSIWEMNGTSVIGGGTFATVSTDWSIAGVGDFNGDGKSDILWRNFSTGTASIWLMNGTSVSGGGGVGTVGTDWHIEGVGDFNGDGKSDILWRNENGVVSIWEMNGTTGIGGGNVGTLASTWHIVGTGDFNGDGKSDIEWRNDTGATAIWEMNGTSVIGGGTATTTTTDWTTQAHHYDLMG